MARLVGQKKAREMWFLARMYDARQALDMGLVNTVVPLAELEAETLAWWGAALASLLCVPDLLNLQCRQQGYTCRRCWQSARLQKGAGGACLSPSGTNSLPPGCSACAGCGSA